MIPVKWVLGVLAPSMRSPSGITGWFAQRLMESSNPPSTREGIQRLGLTSDDTFVELGAGSGAGLKSLGGGEEEEEENVGSDGTADAPAAPAGIPSRIVCVEISQDFRDELEKVKAGLEYQDRVEIYPDDCKAMPFLEDESVDKIFAMNVVYFLDPLEEYLTEIRRVLKPGGVVSFGCKFPALPKDSDVFINVEEEIIVEKMEQAGFEVKSTFVKLPERHSFTEILGRKMPSGSRL
mmetsp:Transcript_32880/g.46719  ORF Transcript_32880/g.46719 Transcript_32880/m.46719 type:complete len:236 (+) Transcript_32880:112-819(+)